MLFGTASLRLLHQSRIPRTFWSVDEEMTHAPTRKCKRPFREMNLDLKAGKHGSLEDQKRRNSGPPQLILDSNFKEKVCQNGRENETKQLLAAQQIALCPQEINKQAKSNGGYGVITLFDGVSSVVPTLTKKIWLRSYCSNPCRKYSSCCMRRVDTGRMSSCEKLKPLRFKLIFSMTQVTQSTNPSTMCTNTLKTKNCNYLTTLGLPVFSRNPWLHSVSQHFCSAHTVR